MSEALRVTRDALVANTELHGRAFGEALSDAIDEVLVDAAAQLGQESPWAIIAMGSYARRELCPGSDVDLMLLHAGGKRGAALVEAASRLWYPLWDAGFVLGQSVRTVKEALAVADEDLDAMTALLHTRVIAGDDALATELVDRVHRLVPKRRARLIGALAGAAEGRAERPGPIAEMLEPNLKEGAGGLRELQAPGWVGWALAPAAGTVPEGWNGGVAALVAAGYLQESDPERLRAARDALLDAGGAPSGHRWAVRSAAVAGAGRRGAIGRRRQRRCPRAGARRNRAHGGLDHPRSLVAAARVGTRAHCPGAWRPCVG